MKWPFLYLVMGIILGFSVIKVDQMYKAGHFSLLPCVYLFGEWRKIPLWSCSNEPYREHCCDRAAYRNGQYVGWYDRQGVFHKQLTEEKGE